MGDYDFSGSLCCCIVVPWIIIVSLLLEVGTIAMIVIGGQCLGSTDGYCATISQAGDGAILALGVILTILIPIVGCIIVYRCTRRKS